MIKIEDKKDCCGCGACCLSCPQECISMSKDGEGFLYPKIKECDCIDCGLCESVCPIINSSLEQGKSEAFAIYANQEQLVKDSSSGGVFSVLAEAVINDGGQVFGASFDEEWQLKTCNAETKEELASLRKAKYVQCETGNAFYKIRTLLETGSKILYCSTPCQVAGLLSFLGKEYDNLYTIDFICHGVASPDVWQQYIASFNSTVTSVDFRDKREGWERNSVCLTLTNGRKIIERNVDNSYMQAFLWGLSMRPSCFSCKFKGLHRKCDITIGDLWGAKYQCPDGYNKDGTSLVLVHENRGKYLITTCKDKFHIVSAPMPASIIFNRSIKESAIEPEKRKLFLENYRKQDFNSIVRECLPSQVSPLKNSLWSRIVSILQRYLFQ